jgi:MoaA/NifB/PqqE/SkfB family radical SAM enzyme
MLGALLHHLLPAPIRSGSPYPALVKLDRDLRDLTGSDALAVRARAAAAELFALLRERFSPPEAQALALRMVNIRLARRHWDRLDAAVLSRPIGLVVDPSNVCRLACPGCVHSARSEALGLFDWPKATLPLARLEQLLDWYGAYAIGVYFCNYGEPLLNRATPLMIRAAKRRLMSTALSTSLSVGRFDPEAYVESGLDFMALSIDGATQSVYQRFRRNGNLELVLDNLRALVAARRRLGRRTPVLSWNFLAFEHNAHEIPRAAAMAADLGVNLFRVVRPFSVAWDDPEIQPSAAVEPGVRRLDFASFANLPENWNPFPCEVDAAAIADAFARSWRAPEPAGAPPGRGRACHWLYKNLVMDAAGRVLPCCGPPRRDGASFVAEAALYGAADYRRAAICERCEWDKTTVNIGAPEIRRYFRAADPLLFDRRTVTLLADW